MALVDPGGERHQLDGVDAEAEEVVDRRGIGERGDGAAELFRDRRVEPGEGLDRDLVDEAGRPARRAAVFRLQPLRRGTIALGISGAVSIAASRGAARSA